MERLIDNGGSVASPAPPEAAATFPGIDSVTSRAHHGFEASRFLLQYLHPDFVNAGVLSRVRCKTPHASESAPRPAKYLPCNSDM